jgi:hypothetical protein
LLSTESSATAELASEAVAFGFVFHPTDLFNQWNTKQDV